MNIKLIRLESNHQELRTDEIIGECDFLPELGDSFYMTAKSLDPKKDFRLIRTSEVMLVHRDGNTIDFNTENSMYRLVILNEQDVQ